AHLLRVIRHRTEAVGDDVKEMPDRRRSQPIDMERWRSSKPSLHYHSLTIAKPAVAGGAKDVESVLSPGNNLRRHCQRKGIYIVLAGRLGQYVCGEVRCLGAGGASALQTHWPSRRRGLTRRCGCRRFTRVKGGIVVKIAPRHRIVRQWASRG